MKPVYVSVSVDVESPQTPLLEKRLQGDGIWCDGNGLELLLTILERHGITGSMFTNIYEAAVRGRPEIERVLTTIQSRGHQAELLTRPVWIDRAGRKYMHQFSLDEQTAIISQGVQFIARSVGRKPAAHRAGGHGFNLDTLRACAQAGLGIDSSECPGHPNAQAALGRNRLTRTEGIIEVPATCLMRGGRALKIDPGMISLKDLQEFLAFLKDQPDHNFLNLSMPCYCLGVDPDDPARLRPNPALADRLESMLALLVADRDCLLTPMAELEPAMHALEETAAGRQRNRPVAPETGNNALQRALAGRQGKVLLVLATEEALEPVRGQEFGPNVILFTPREEVYRQALSQGLNPASPPDFDRLFLFHHLPFDDIQHLRESKGYSPTRYQYLFDEIAQDAILHNPAVRYCGEYDLYVNGDYNAANLMGHIILYTIEVLTDLVAQLKPELVICLDGPKGSMEFFVLETHLASCPGPEFLHLQAGRDTGGAA